MNFHGTFFDDISKCLNFHCIEKSRMEIPQTGKVACVCNRPTLGCLFQILPVLLFTALNVFEGHKILLN